MTCLCTASALAGSGPRQAIARRRRGLSLRACALAGLLLAAGSASAAKADWLDDMGLRGSLGNKSYMRWDGVNFGAHIGVSNMNSDFSNVTSSAVHSMLHNSTLENEQSPSSWPLLDGSSTTNGRSYGAFLGYSKQWEQLVLGVDLTYSHMSNMTASSGPTSIDRVVTTSDSVSHNVFITGQASNQLVDYATFRARAGYAMGQFLPYAFIGAAVGRFNYSSLVSLTDTQTAPGGAISIFTPPSVSTNRSGAIVGGFTTGLGVDVALLPNVFVRGEWEFNAFGQVNGIRSSMNTGRVALGLKF